MEIDRNKQDYNLFYELGEKIGKGSFGEVFKAKDRETNEIKAIKKIEIDNDDEDADIEEGIKTIINELNGMKICSDNNSNDYSVKYYEYFRNKKEFIIVMELCDNNLLKIWKKRAERGEVFKPEEIHKIMSQLNNTFKIMVNHNIVHRDIKLENILVKYEDEQKNNYIVKLTDYGISKQITTTKICKTHAGTGMTMAPEILEGKEKYDNKCDLWSIGVIIYQLAFKEYPYKGQTEFALLNNIKNFRQKLFRKTNNVKLDDLIRRLLVYEPENRISWYDYFVHPFFGEDRTKEDYKKYYDQLNYITHGAYGEIFKGKEKGKEELKAIKVINLNNLKEKLKSEHEDKESLLNHLNICREGYINEFEIMKTCSKNNINSVECYEYFDNKDNFIIIMELCDGNLLDLFNKKKENDKGLNIEELLKIMNQLNNAFKIMKENNIIHRDLKLENILIKYNDEEHKNYTIKLADYGCSKRLDSLLENYCSTYIGTPIYMAPEILNEDKYNFKSDLWSIGIIIYKLFFDKFLFYGERIAVKNKINKFDNKSIKTGNTKLDDLLQNLLEKDPEKRLDWDTYLNHPFFKDNNLIIINLIYETEKKRIMNIFGEKFVLNNDNNIELRINGENCDLIKKFELKKGINNIEMIIKNKINNLEYMFYECSSLKNIDDLKNLDVKGIKNFSHIFSGCKSLSDIKSLENWDVSNGINFSNMFCGCKLISDLNPLKEWNISKAKNFSWMFRLCQSITDLKSLQNWDVSNVNNFIGIFSECTKLSDIKSLQNWNISNGKDFSWMFS